MLQYLSERTGTTNIQTNEEFGIKLVLILQLTFFQQLLFCRRRSVHTALRYTSLRSFVSDSLSKVSRRLLNTQNRERREKMSGKPGGGGGAGSGPTAAAAATAIQKQKSLLHRLETEISNIVDHFTQLVSVSRVNDPPVRNSQDSFQMEVRAARMTQAADSLLKLVSELKQTAMFSGFASLNENVDRRIVVFNQEAESTEQLLERIGEQAAASLKELETHYYSSVIREVQNED